MENLPIASEKFDLVISFGVLEHFEDMKPAIKEMVRILKKGGTFFAAVSPRKHSIQLVADLTINVLMRFLYNIKHGWFKEAFLNSYPAKPEFYENSFSARQYVKIIEECGLTNVKLSGSRPFPSLNLPVYLYCFYIQFMKILRFAHLFFETHSSKLTELIGVEWNIIGYKK
jgi:ubiquinone/menaquinone biosynthesis C-methylase UbiE